MRSDQAIAKTTAEVWWITYLGSAVDGVSHSHRQPTSQQTHLELGDGAGVDFGPVPVSVMTSRTSIPRDAECAGADALSRSRGTLAEEAHNMEAEPRDIDHWTERA